MGDRWRIGFIALTIVVVAVALAVAVHSAANPATPRSYAAYVPTATLAPSPSASAKEKATLRPPAPTATPAPTTTAAPKASPWPCAIKPLAGHCMYYVVQLGETMGGIAKKFGVTTSALRAVNPDITDPKYLKAGRTILIPPPGWAPSPSPRSSPSPNSSSS